MTQANQPSMWNLTSGGAYDLDKTYTNSADAHGHSRQRRTRYSPPMEAEVEAFIASRLVPDLKTFEDFARDACVHRMHYWMTKVWPQGKSVITAEMMQSDINRYKARCDTWELTIKSLADTGEALLAKGALEELSQLLTTYDQDDVETDMPVICQQDFQDVMNTLQDRLKRAISKTR